MDQLQKFKKQYLDIRNNSSGMNLHVNHKGVKCMDALSKLSGSGSLHWFSFFCFFTPFSTGPDLQKGLQYKL